MKPKSVTARLAFAQAAIQGLMSAPSNYDAAPEQLSADAWRVADAMMRTAPKEVREELARNDAEEARRG